jgi:hypothetical protein
MIRKLIARIKLRFDPPQIGDVYYGDPFAFMIPTMLEAARHGLTDLSGTRLWTIVPSDGCYRLTIESDGMPYYRCTAEVLCKSTDGDKTEWRKRSQPCRIMKQAFHAMILDKEIAKP